MSIALRQRMMHLDRPPEAASLDVSVNLGGRNVGVAEHLLNDPEVGAASEQMAGEGVAQRVRRDCSGIKPRCCSKRLELDRQMLTRQMTLASMRGEQPW